MIFKNKAKVKLLGRSTIEYSITGKKIVINSEMLVGDNDMVIYSNSIEYWILKNEKQKITPEEKQSIIIEITEYFNKKRIKIVWD